jgi:thioesterase domain-containing protein
VGTPAHDIAAHTDFLRSGGNSLAVMRMSAQLRRQHGLVIDAGAFLARPSFEQLCRLASEPPRHSPSGCVVVGAIDAPKVLVLVPGKGGQALGLYRLGELVQARLGPDHAVVIMDLEAMLLRVPHHRPLWYLYERMGQLMKEIDPQRVVGFVGFSLGGMLAIHLAREFPPGSAPPVWLLDSYAPRIMVRSLWRRIERRLARIPLWWRAERGATHTLPAAAADESEDGAPPRTSPLKGLWDAIQTQLADESARGAGLEVHLIQAQQSLDHVGLVWRRASNGFNPRDYGRWYLHRLDAMHLDLPGALASDTADLFATGLRWSALPC